MKKYVILLLLLLPFICFSQTFTRTISFRGASIYPTTISTNTCSTTSTTNIYDSLIEGFEAEDGYDQTWTEVGATTNLVAGADTSALTTAKPPGNCDKAFKSVVLPMEGIETYSRTDVGLIDLDTINVSIAFNFYISSGPDTHGETYSIFGTSQTTSPFANGPNVRISNSGGNLLLDCIGASTSASITVLAGQWYTILITLDTAQAAGGCTFSIFSGGSQVSTTKTFQRLASNDLRYVFLGVPFSLSSGEDGTFYMDCVTVKTYD